MIFQFLNYTKVFKIFHSKKVVIFSVFTINIDEELFGKKLEKELYFAIFRQNTIVFLAFK